MSAGAQHDARKHSHGCQDTKARRESKTIDGSNEFLQKWETDEIDGSLSAEVGNGPWYCASCVGSVLGPSFRGEKWEVIASVTSSALRNIPAHATVSPQPSGSIGFDKIGMSSSMTARSLGLPALRMWAGQGWQTSATSKEGREVSVPPGAAFCAETLSSKSCSSVSELRFELGLELARSADDHSDV